MGGCKGKWKIKGGALSIENGCCSGWWMEHVTDIEVVRHAARLKQFKVHAPNEILVRYCNKGVNKSLCFRSDSTNFESADKWAYAFAKVLQVAKERPIKYCTRAADGVRKTNYMPLILMVLVGVFAAIVAYYMTRASPESDDEIVPDVEDPTQASSESKVEIVAETVPDVEEPKEDEM